MAQAPERVAWTVSGLTQRPAVMVASDRGWVAADDGAMTICTAALCRPIARREACAAPRCPGTGTMLVTSERIAEVADFPTDYTGYTQAIQNLYGEPALGPLTAYFAPHPSPPQPETPPHPPRFSEGEHDWAFAELTVLGGIGTGLVHISAPMWHVQANLALQFRLRPFSSTEEDLAWIFGSQMGFELRVHAIGNINGRNPDEFAFFVGLGPSISYVDWDDVLRLPPAYSWLAPELGFVVRSDQAVDTAYYVAWSLPVTVLVHDNVGLQVRTSLFLIDDWYSGDDAEVLTTLDIGFVFR